MAAAQIAEDAETAPVIVENCTAPLEEAVTEIPAATPQQVVPSREQPEESPSLQVAEDIEPPMEVSEDSGPTKPQDNPLRSVDPDLIQARVQNLPIEIRQIVENDFKGEYTAIEKIDSNKLI